MFSRALSLNLAQPQDGSILSISRYEDASQVQGLVEAEHSRVMTQWASYLEQRRRGRGPELFAALDAARKWLIH